MTGASVLLDVTRTISRAGLGAATGIDRVERRWLSEALAGRWGQAQFIARIASSLHVTDVDGMAAILGMIDGEAPLPKADLRGAVALSKPPVRRKIESEFRRRAIGLTGAPVYANVGHANLTSETIAAIRTLGAARVVVKIHDIIPLEFPEFARADGPAKMAERLSVAERADAVVYNSADTRARSEARMAAPPPGVVAPLGLDIRRPAAMPHDGFVTLGTIEPRKNHALLLDVWERIGDGTPTLHIIGRRGWMNEAVFARLDAFPANVVEHGGLDDRTMLDLLAGARALLFPSFAEGYGLPLAEALSIRCPVIASDLPALREVGGAAPDWLAPDDVEGWSKAVADFADPKSPRRAAQMERIGGWTAPGWRAHFEAADQVMGVNLS